MLTMPVGPEFSQGIICHHARIKPSRAYFEDLDAHWPNRAILTIKENVSAASLLYGRTVPSVSSSLEATLAETFTPNERPTYVRWAATPALRVRSGDKEEILAISGDAYWAIQTSGPDLHAMLDLLLLSTSIADLSGATIRKAP
jgi:hypothetical protein